MPAPAPDVIDPRFSKPRTLFFGIGGQKCATSWLDVYLRRHPDVCMPVRKEQHYWNTVRLGHTDRAARKKEELRELHQQNIVRRLFRSKGGRRLDRSVKLIDAMLSDRSASHRAYGDVLFQDYVGQPVVGEITPAYALLEAEHFAEMAAMAADVRFIYVMRDPFDRLVSGVMMNIGRETPEQGVDAARFAESLAKASHGGADPSFLRSRYDMTIERLERVVPKERICYFFYESLFRQSEIDRLTDFLGIARRPAEFERRVNAGQASGPLIDAATQARAMAALAPVYDFVRARFGDAAPQQWRTTGSPAGSAAPATATATQA